MRLDKFLCKSTSLNRVQATLAIHAGMVSVNGDVILEPLYQVHENNDIFYEGQKLMPRASRYIMLNKPLDTLCSNVDGTYPSVFHLLGFERWDDLHIVGRLDADTTGLVLITDDGRWSFEIIRPEKKCEKTYRVNLRDPICEDAISIFQRGIQLQNEPKLTQPAKLKILSSNEVLLTLTEGKYHQVKRMFAALGNRVNALHRLQIGELVLDIDEGEWRYLSNSEVAAFYPIQDNK